MSGEHITVHRLLDEAFAGVTTTGEVQDLKEEIRAGLVERVAELTASGMRHDDAARRAVEELGDIRGLVAAEFPSAMPDDATPHATGAGTAIGAGTSTDTGTAPGSGSGAAVTVPATATTSRNNATASARPPSAPPRESAAALAARHRVPPSPGFVALTILASGLLVLTAAGYVNWTVSFARSESGPFPLLAWAAVASALVAWIVGMSLSQETATHYPMPRSRATLFAAGWGLVALCALAAPIPILGTEQLGASLHAWYAAAASALIAGAALLSYLTATRTNRAKAWVVEQTRRHTELGDRFEKDPAAAARFGVYTVALTVLAAAALLTVGFTAGWGWALLVLPIWCAAFFVLLARMLFAPAGGGEPNHR